MSAEIELVSDSDGLAVIGDPGAVERFLAPLRLAVVRFAVVRFLAVPRFAVVRFAVVRFATRKTPRAAVLSLVTAAFMSAVHVLILAYALVPHAGGWREGGVLGEAIRFNAPIRWTTAIGPSFAAVDDTNLVLDTVKLAERSDEVVLRLYEAHGSRGTARVRLGTPPHAAKLANALEEPFADVQIDRDELVLPYLPHQVLTVLVGQR